MGGNLFKNESHRLSRAEYEKQADAICCTLHDFGRRAILPPCFHEKKDFGDIDIIVEGNCLTDKEIDFCFGDVKIHRNSPVISILLDGVQVDLNFHQLENYETAVKYYSHNDASNFLGRIAHSLGYSLGHYGLAYYVRFSDSDSLGKIVVSKDWSKILEFLGFEGDQWEKGFGDADDVYRWITTSVYFNQDKFAYENLTHVTRIRDRKRPVYHGFIEWLKDKEFPKYRANKAEHLFRGIYFFGDEWFKPVFSLIEERKRKEVARGIFSGKDLIDLGYAGKELGRILESFKKSVPDYDNFILSKTKEEMIKLFQNYSK